MSLGRARPAETRADLSDGRGDGSIPDPTPAARGASTLSFRRYRVYPTARRIVLDGRDVPLGARAFDLLVTLLRARGQVVSQFDIIRQVWPSTTVDDANLRSQVAILRRVLGVDRNIIKTIPGRGYLIAEECAPADMGVRRETSPFKAAQFKAARARRAAAIRDGDPVDVDQRVARLEQENLRLRLAIASLTSGRGAHIPSNEVTSGL